MEKGRVGRMGSVIIGNAIVWGAMIIGISLALKGTDCYPQIQNMLGAGPVVTTMLIFYGFLPLKKKENASEDADSKSADTEQ
jgi:hypothetical protein